MKVFLGVDGGGTKTDFLLIDESGQVLASRREGSAYYLQIGVEVLRSMMLQGIRGVLADAGLSPNAVSFACIGLPAYGEDSALLSRLDAIAEGLLPTPKYRCVNDMVCGWAAALAGRDGINIVAGTGSIGYGEFDGRSARAGGWGELFSDEGSAYWVAREGLTLFSRMSDGRADQGPLYQLMRRHFKLRADLDVCAVVYGPPPLTRSELAALAPLVSSAAHAGDRQAACIIEMAAQQLAEVVHAVRDQLGAPQHQPLPVSYSGGMFHQDNGLTQKLESILSTGERRYEFAAPRLAPRAGAALYAAKLSGSPLTPQAVAQLTRTHGSAPSLEETD